MYKPVHIPNELGRKRWYVFSHKLQREIRLYGDLEYDHWVFVEMDPAIVNYCEKPKQIVQSYEGEIISTTFDMWLKKDNGYEEFVSVDYSFKLDPQHKKSSKKAIKEISVQRRWCEENRFNFRSLTEADIRGNMVLMDNLKRLIPFKPIDDLGAIKNGNEILEEIKSGNSKVVNLEQKFKQYKNVSIMNDIFTLIRSGYISANIEETPLGFQTEVKLYEEKAIT
ncbi:hypothetical protein Elgi_59100 [Paenibacillus elgii]|uniref:hypothetical protein n=1 Tax=Paenibacillus elgii TaxID=189691 RepID=UPI002D7B1D61|nr:hypothetical protein Elgi_59100 [Paenibacillus elgii]